MILTRKLREALNVVFGRALARSPIARTLVSATQNANYGVSLLSMWNLFSACVNVNTG